NSSSMADKQALLAQAIPDLVTNVVNPRCLDDTTRAPITSGQPADPLAPCPPGTSREFPPIEDIHIGLVSSSLGSFGADGCPEKPPLQCGGPTPNSISNDDHGHLVTRTDPCGTGGVPTWKNEGFIAWDSKMSLNPPGTASIADLTTAISNLIIG